MDKDRRKLTGGNRLTAAAIAAAMSVALALPLAGCGGSGNNGNTNTPGGDIVLPTHSEGSSIEMKEYAVTKTVADFKYGVAGPYDKYTKSVEEGWNYWLSRSFAGLTPEYSYTPDASGDALEYKSNCVWSDDGSDDDCNYVTIYPSSKARTDGTAESEFLFYIPCLNPEGTPINYGVYPKEYENYLDLSEYDNLSFIFCAQSELGSDVAFEIYLKNHGSERYKVYEYKGKGGKMRINIDLRAIETDRRDRLESLTVVNDPLILRRAVDADTVTERIDGKRVEVTAEEYRAKYSMPALVKLDGSAEEYLSSEAGAEWRKWQEICNIDSHAVPVIATPNIKAVAQFAAEEAEVTEGRGFEGEEYSQEAKICIISESLAQRSSLKVGDKLRLSFYELDEGFIARMGSTYMRTANVAAAYYSPRRGFAAEHL